MSFFIRTSSPEDWKSKLADPEKHWKPGYSARTLAYSWMAAQGFPRSVRDVFQKTDYPLFKNIEFLLGIIEHEVPLPGGRHPSQNDIFVLAKSQKNLVAISVEGKVSESFGEIVAEWFKDKSAGKAVRLEFLCESLGLDKDSIQGIRYQLLHRATSALLEARRFNASTALMLVHSFSQKNDGFHDYSRFAKHLGVMTPQLNAVHFAKRLDDVDLYLAWVTGKEKYLSIEEDKSVL
jgi:hypothetical protein